MPHRPNVTPTTRHVVSINDLKNKEIDNIFELAASYLKELPDPTFSYRIGHSTDLASRYILATLFYEPSTRTRLSFESAMLRLGGKIITSADPATSSAAKGESLADSVRVISNYADIIVIRHPRDGAARLAAEYSSIPVINGGDGSHEHPTQTLCDLFTLKQKNKTLKNMNVAISGDLRGSRTIHSFVYALARFGADITLMPAKGMELPKHVDARLREEFGYVPAPRSTYEKDEPSIDAFYITPEEPHQLSLIPNQNLVDVNIRIREKLEKIDVVYVTRFQKERWSEKEQHYPKIDAKFLKGPRYSQTSVLHPLPRVGELDVSFDTDRRAVYFRQAAYGVPVRMALISLLLKLHKNKSLQRFNDGFEKSDHLVYSQPVDIGVQCVNANCIVREPSERQHAKNKFYVIGSKPPHKCKLRCVYCETDIDETAAEHFVFADRSKGHYTMNIRRLQEVAQEKMKDIVIFPSESDAIAEGLHSKEDRAASTHWRTKSAS